MSAPAYKAKAMKAVNPATETPCYPNGEYCATAVQMNTRPPKRPSKASVSGVLIDGPYGGKKPA